MDRNFIGSAAARARKRLTCAAVAVIAAVFCTGAQAAISVGAGGVGPLTFNAAPAVADWATVSIAGAGNTYGDTTALETAIQGRDASSISTALPTDTANPPGTQANARWNSTLRLLQTRPTGNAATLLKGVFVNNSGRTIDAMTITFDQGTFNFNAGHLPGYSVFYSLTGAAGSWIFIPALSGSEPAAPALSATINPAWPNGSTMYLLFVDDNNDGNTDPSYTIDNLVFSFPGEPPSITGQPATQSVLQCRIATFNVAAIGSLPFTYQWYKNNSPISGATASSYSITNVQAGDAGNYHVEVVNGSGTTPSAPATLTVTPDTQAPQILYAIGNPGGSTITLTFNEPLDLDTAQATFNYEMFVVGNSNSPVTAGAATLDNMTNVIITTDSPRVSGQNYFVRIYGSKDSCAQNEALQPVDVHVVQMIELLAVDGVSTTWRYNEQNIDLAGTGWQNLTYNDSDWLTGIGVLTQTGGEPGQPPGWVIGSASLVPQSGGGPETVYFRAPFNLPTTPGSVTVQFTHWIDDGAVFYVNGTEAGRIRIAAGAFTHATDGGSPAEPHPEEGPIMVPGSMLFGGDNVMAVEVHQSGTASTDVAMGVRMIAYVTNFSSGLSILTQPQDLTVNEKQSATLSVNVDGSVPFTYQWSRNGSPIPGATTPVLSFPSALPSDTGDYSVFITNPAGTTNSRVAHLTVVPDTTAPRMLSVLGNTNLNTFTITFSEPVEPLEAEETFSYIIQLVGGGGDLPISTATLTNGTNVILVTDSPRTAGLNYEIEAIGITDRSAAQNALSPSTARIASGVVILTPDDVTAWRYNQSGVDFTGNGWNTTTFNDSAWDSGLAGFSTPTPEIVPAGLELRTTALVAQSATGPKTVYFRVPFNFPGSLSGAFLEAYGVVDDGAVFYVNGADAGRLRIAAGPVTFTTDASTSPEATDVHTPTSAMLSTTGLQATGNLLAVELHQSGTASSDAVLSIQLIAYITDAAPSGPRMTVSRNATTGQITITWPGGGTLQSSPVVGPGAVWTPLPTATSPFTFTPSGDQGYFRVSQ